MKKHSLNWILFILIVITGAVGGNYFGPFLSAEDESEEELLFGRLSSLIEEIEMNYIEPPEPAEIVYGSIRGMLETLDPHSNFLEPESFKQMREEQKGSFFGLGIIIAKRSGKLTVISPIEDTPAFRAGIRSGDVLSHIDGEPTDVLPLDKAVSRLRGEKGTSVTITIVRRGIEEPFERDITRDEIPSESVRIAYMIKPGVGLIRLRVFNKTTDRELAESIDKLKKLGMEKLILDLRFNPGGLLDQAVKVSSYFLYEGELVVYTRGRIFGSNNEFRALGGRNQEDLSLIVLVDEASASASEIVAGAVQDHDRGLIVGERTWGKGLVQSLYDLPYNAGLALTTAQYYTPSGRLIQRDFTNRYDYLFNRNGEGEKGKPKMTDAGREVYEKGGIEPDVVVETKKQSPFITGLGFRDAFFQFGSSYLLTHEGEIDKETVGELNTDEDLMEEFKEFLKEEKIEYGDEDLETSISRIVKKSASCGQRVFFSIDIAIFVFNAGGKGGFVEIYDIYSAARDGCLSGSPQHGDNGL